MCIKYICSVCQARFQEQRNKNENKNHSSERGGQYLIEHSSCVRQDLTGRHPASMNPVSKMLRYVLGSPSSSGLNSV